MSRFSSAPRHAFTLPYTLQAHYEKLQRRLEAMYDDKLDGRIDQGFYDRKSSAWEEEQDDILRKIEHHQGANRSYIDEGVKLLELSQRAVTLYEKQTDQEKRLIINFVCSDSSWKGGRLQSNYRQPFDMLVRKNISHQKEKAHYPEKKGHFEFWLSLVDALRHQFSGPTKEMMDTLFVTQAQEKDGFLAAR